MSRFLGFPAAPFFSRVRFSPLRRPAAIFGDLRRTHSSLPLSQPSPPSRQSSGLLLPHGKAPAATLSLLFPRVHILLAASFLFSSSPTVSSHIDVICGLVLPLLIKEASLKKHDEFDLLYKCRRKGTRSSFIPENIWAAWQAIWKAERWQANSATARSNKNTELAGPSTGSTKHTVGFRSIVEHILDLEHELQRPPTCWKIFTKTHKFKDDTFIDLRSQALHVEMSTRVAQASAPAVMGGERQDLSTDQVNEIYYDVVGGRKKSSTLYGLGSQARVVYDHVMAPRARGRPNGSSSAIEAPQQENQELNNRLSALEASQRNYDQLARQIMTFMDVMGLTPPMPRYHDLRGADTDADTQDPNAPD
ncbi:uncharacterized protein LOC141843928 [Curcuma longa]|uniref:uncharacterized protein LOC141843928 n=1 Tax=Curcuma longa TaxID=136217 RepID=UPI003D9F17E5